jgi:hypothetical protein
LAGLVWFALFVHSGDPAPKPGVVVSFEPNYLHAHGLQPASGVGTSMLAKHADDLIAPRGPLPHL